jgi:DNA mismatch repair protein MutL
MSIHLLPPEVASQIAAGEVVERPASVVKELLENAIDAHANHISVRVEGGGQQLVEVADDGSGIPTDEIELAVSRHATSKLQSADDLFRLQSLGFRGEALASIGSVSHMTLTSRSKESEVGSRIRVEGGNIFQPEGVGAPVGTVVRVEDLFYNVPARRKFLKQEVTERRQIDTLVTRYALAYPMIRFSLVQDGRPSLQTSGNGNRREVLAVLYGPDTARLMIEVISEEEGLSITGFTSPTSLTRSNRRELTFFVNGRPVQDAALSSAVLQAYHTLLMVGRYPIGILFVDIAPDQVDVNVHPTKAEVRFREANRVFTGLQRAVRRALLAHTPVPDINSAQFRWSQSEALPTPARAFNPAWNMAGDWDLQRKPDMERVDGADGPEGTALDGPSDQPQASVPTAQAQMAAPILRLVGQIAAAYLVAEGPDGLYLIDQHAAHERVLFERMRIEHQTVGSKMISQTLLAPVSVELPPAGARLLEDQLSILNQLGFQVEHFGPGAFLVRAVPALLTGLDPAAALRVLVEDFEEDEAPLKTEIEAKIIGRICKRAAVKAGQVLSAAEQRALLTDLEACSSPRTCPHGRPTMIHLSVDLLERQFGRRGPR